MLITWPPISISTHFSELGHYLKNLLITLNNNKMNTELLNQLNTMQTEHIKILNDRIKTFENRIEILKNTIQIDKITIKTQQDTIEIYLDNLKNKS